MSHGPETSLNPYDRGYLSETAPKGDEAGYAKALLRLLERRGLITVPRDARYLDLGCGLGYKTRAIAQLFGEAVGLDSSIAAIDAARRLNPSERLEYSAGDERTGLGRFDLVTAFGFSLFNSREPAEYAAALHSAAEHFLSSTGYLVAVAQTDLSQATRTGWFNHSVEELERVAERVHGRLYFPHLDGRSYIYSPRQAALRVARLFRHGLREYCLVVSSVTRTA